MNRQPRGIPTGGEFAKNDHGDAPGALSSSAPEQVNVWHARELNTRCDELWKQDNAARDRGATIIGHAIRYSEAHQAVRDYAQLCTDDRGFEQVSFSTPLPVAKHESYLPGMEPEEEVPPLLVGSRSEWAEQASDDEVRQEISRDIEMGVQTGALSVLFRYTTSVTRDNERSRKIRVSMHMIDRDTPKNDYVNSRRRWADVGGYSDRVRGTVAKIESRLSAYVVIRADDKETVRVSTDLSGLGSDDIVSKRRYRQE